MIAGTAMWLIGSSLRDTDAWRVRAMPAAVLKERVKQYIAENLHDPGLSIDAVARAMRCSKRYLHRVFEDEAMTLDRYIWAARLEKCRAALSDPNLSGRTISEI